MGLCNILGQGYGVGYPDGYEAGKNGGGSPMTRPIRIVVGHHHIGNFMTGGGCYTAPVQCNATINWGDQMSKDSPPGHEGQVIYYRNGTCTNGHSIHVEREWPASQTAPDLAYQPCDRTVYAFPAGHPTEGEFVRNADVYPGQTPSGVLHLAANEKVTGVQKFQ